MDKISTMKKISPSRKYAVLGLVCGFAMSACNADMAGSAVDEGPIVVDGLGAELQALRAAASTPRTSCVPSGPPFIRYQDDVVTIYIFHEVMDEILFSDEIIESPHYDDYIAALAVKSEEFGLDLFDQTALLTRQRQIFVDVFGDQAAHDFDLLLNGEVGVIAPMNCLQSIMFNLQNQDYPLSGEPTEGVGYVLRRTIQGKDVLRIYMQTEGDYIPSLEKLRDLGYRDLEHGWEFVAHLHNHPFFFANFPSDIAGTIIPSTPDVLSYLNHSSFRGLQKAWITNGVHNLELQADEFDLFDTNLSNARLTNIAAGHDAIDLKMDF